jgi:hypothetical protein
MNSRFQPRIDHSQAYNNSENTHWRRQYKNNVLTETSSVYYTIITQWGVTYKKPYNIKIGGAYSTY